MRNVAVIKEDCMLLDGEALDYFGGSHREITARKKSHVRSLKSIKRLESQTNLQSKKNDFWNLKQRLNTR